MAHEHRHRAVLGGLRGDRERRIAGLSLPPALMPVVDAHARLRGPYTAGGTVVRRLAPAALRSWPGLAYDHEIEIRAVAPELSGAVPVRRETLFNRVPAAERTRIHSRFRTLRIAHGLTEFIRDHLVRAAGNPPWSLVIENLQHADPTDRELVAVMLRRLDPALLTLMICAAAGPLGEPLDGALAAHATADPLPSDPPAGLTRTDPPVPASAAPASVSAAASATATGPADTARYAAAYVAADGSCDDPRLLAAYQQLDRGERERLHDARADQLSADQLSADQRSAGKLSAGKLGRDGDWSLRLGAVPYHRERGGDPAGAGVAALQAASEHCLTRAFHHACVDLARRGRALAGPDRGDGLWWTFTRRAATSLAALGRAAEAEALYDEARASSADPVVHHTAAYDTAMLYARHHAPTLRDYVRAKAWLNEAVAISALLPDPHDRAFHTAFYLNGQALIEIRLGDPAAALRLVDDSLALFDRELPPGSHPLDRCSLVANRARVLAALGRPEEALRACDTLIGLDPDYAEYYFDRGNLLRGSGRDDEALADYDSAIRLGLPFPEAHYNRAGVLAALGHDDDALAALCKVLELDPGSVDAYVNRAGLLAARGDTAGARADVGAGLALDPGNPHLTCVLGQLEMAAGHAAAARAAFDAALARDPCLAAAWASRATLAYESGDPAAAVADLTRALEAGQDPLLLFNRATAYRAAGRLAEARADLARARLLAPRDPDILRLLAELGTSPGSPRQPG